MLRAERQASVIPSGIAARRAGQILVDDHSICAATVSTDLLQHRGGMQVAAATGDPTRVVDLLREHRPATVVLDLRMPTTDGLSLLRHIRAGGVDTPAVILTMSDSQDDLAAALPCAGVKGLLGTWAGT